VSMWMGDSHFSESPIHSMSGSQEKNIMNQGFTEMWSGIHNFFFGVLVYFQNLGSLII
jgi:hypothetical protein